MDHKILERIRKLHRHAESAKQLGNMAEAAAFAGKVMELMAEHKLEMSMLSALEQDQQDAMGKSYINPDTRAKRPKKFLIAWKRRLAHLVANNHGCYMVLSDSNFIWLIGRESDRQVAEFMITYLILFGLRQAAKECIAARKIAYASPDPESARGFEAAWHDAYVDAISQRYREMREAAKQGTKTGTAMVLLSTARKEAEEHARKTMSLRNVGPARGPSNVWNEAGRAGGAAAGRSVDLSGLDNGRNLGRGRKALPGS